MVALMSKNGTMVNKVDAFPATIYGYEFSEKGFTCDRI